MRPLTGSARSLHRIRSGDEVTDSGSSTHSRRGGRRRSGRQNCKSNQRGKQYSQNGSPPAIHIQPLPDCDTGQVVTATGHTALRIHGTFRAEEDSALEQSVELMASVPDLPLPMTLARIWGVILWRRPSAWPASERSVPYPQPSRARGATYPRRGYIQVTGRPDRKSIALQPQVSDRDVWRGLVSLGIPEGARMIGQMYCLTGQSRLGVGTGSRNPVGAGAIRPVL